MAKLFRTGFLLSLFALLTGCGNWIGEKVHVNPGYVAKVLTPNGYKPETVGPSAFRLEPCFLWCDSLVYLEASDRPKKEPFSLFMPKDQLNMSFDVRMTLSIDKEKVDNLFDRLTPENKLISFDKAYLTYAQPIIRDVVRQAMAEYTINEIASSREAVSQNLYNIVSERLAGTPINVKTFGVADVQFPPVITKAKEDAAERKEQIEKEKAQFEIQKITLERQLEEAKMSRAIEREKAEGTKEVNDILAKSVTDKFLSYRALEVMEVMATSENKVFFPVEALGTVGLQQSIFTDQIKKTTKGG